MKLDDILGKGKYEELCHGNSRPSRGTRRHIRTLKAEHRRAEANKPKSLSESNRTSAGQMSKVSSAPSLSSDSGITATRNGIIITGRCEAEDVINELRAKRLIDDYVDIKQDGQTRHGDVSMQASYVQNDSGYIKIGTCSTQRSPITIERA